MIFLNASRASLFLSLFTLFISTPLWADGEPEKARIICDDLSSAKDYIHSAMENISSHEKPVYFLNLPKYTAEKMSELVQKGVIIKCFARHTSRPSAFNYALFQNREWVDESYPPFIVYFDNMLVDYGAYKANRIVISFNIR